MGDLTAAALVLLIRALVLLAGIFSPRIHPAIGDGVEGITNATPWLAWDGWHYLRILQFGYPPMEDGVIPHRVAFFPIYPLAARLLTPIFSPEVSLIVLANVCMLVGFIFMYRWLRAIASPRAAMIGVLLMCAYPGAVFFSAALTEGPFFMMVAIALWLLQQKRFLAAALISALASALRPTAISLAVLVSLCALLDLRDWRQPKALLKVAVLGVISLSGLIIHEIYLVNRYHRIDAISAAQAQVLDMMQANYRADAAAGQHRYSLAFFIDRATKPSGWNRAFWLPITLVLFIGWVRPRQIPRAFFVLPLIIWLMCTIPEKGLRISSAIRYESAAIPLFALVAIWLNDLRSKHPAVERWLLSMIIIAQVALQIYYAVLFSRGVWVG